MVAPQSKTTHGPVPNESWTVRNEQGTAGALSFTSYVQNSTFHGLNYAFQPSHTLERRLLWGLAVSLSIVVFSYQVVSRFQDYFTYNSNVNMEAVYTNSINFPSVTICNQNSHRLSKAVEHNMYTLLYDKYVQIEADQIPESSFANVTSDYRGFLLDAGHQIEDLIHSCSWNDSPCNMSDFHAIITDYGLCYTFNKRNLQVYRPGSAAGLSLMLNIERYEYGPGPHNDIGIKVLLHEPEDFPLMSDQGFTLPPKSHAMVGIQQTEMERLPAPYGSCKLGTEPRSVCMLKCQAEEMIRACGCHDVYIPPDMNATYCDLEKRMYGNCSRSATRPTSSLCDCAVPCHTTIYSAHLSYSSLSPESIQRLWNQQPERRQHAEDQFIHATELIQRVHPEIVRRDTENVDRLKNQLDALNQATLDVDNAMLHANLRLDQVTLDNMEWLGSMIYWPRVDSLLVLDLDKIRNQYNETVDKLISNHSLGELGVDWTILDQWIGKVYPIDNDNGLPFFKVLATVGPLFLYPMIMRKPSLYEQLLKGFDEYLEDANRTKSDLYAEISTPSYDFLINSLLKAASDLTYSLLDQAPQLASFMNDMKHGYKTAYNLKLPVITTTTLKEELALVPFVQDKFSTNNTILDIAEKVMQDGVNGSDSFMELITAMNDHFYGLLTNLIIRVDEAKNDFVKSLQQTKMEMTPFGSLKTRILDPENFIEMDVFYPDLSYTRIQHLAAFSFISLLSEVGGFLGLLLGASVLTVCELVDFSIMAIFNHFRRETKIHVQAARMH